MRKVRTAAAVLDIKIATLTAYPLALLLPLVLFQAAFEASQNARLSLSDRNLYRYTLLLMVPR